MAADRPLLDESDLALMREISRDSVQTQRALSRRAGLSLGMTNLVLKRLARRGMIKARQLDWNRTQYLLTPKGAVEKTRKLLDYTRYTVKLFRQIQDNFNIAVRREHDCGLRRFWFVAQDELEGVLRETAAALSLDGVRCSFAPGFAGVPEDAQLVLSATHEAPPASAPWRHVRLVDFLDMDFRLP